MIEHVDVLCGVLEILGGSGDGFSMEGKQFEEVWRHRLLGGSDSLVLLKLRRYGVSLSIKPTVDKRSHASHLSLVSIDTNKGK